MLRIKANEQLANIQTIAIWRMLENRKKSWEDDIFNYWLRKSGRGFTLTMQSKYCYPIYYDDYDFKNKRFNSVYADTNRHKVFFTLERFEKEQQDD